MKPHRDPHKIHFYLKAFGAPYYVTDDSAGKTHAFFGCDRIHILAHVLGEKYEGPLNELNKAKLP